MPEPDVDELITLLHQTLTAFRRHGRDAGTGLGPSHHMLLWRLQPCARPGSPWPHGPSRVSDLAQALQLTPAAITQLVAELERRGYVQRARHQSDRRVVLVSLTPTGEEVLAEHRRRRRAEVQALVEALEPQDREALLRILYRLRAIGMGGAPQQT